MRHLNSDVIFWMYEFAGAAMASVAHALSRRLSLVYFASAFDIPHVMPDVSMYPLLDSNYSSANLQKSNEFLKHQTWEQERDCKGQVKKFDRRRLGGALYRSYKGVRDRFSQTG
jgi:hypothetical protein